MILDILVKRNYLPSIKTDDSKAEDIQKAVTFCYSLNELGYTLDKNSLIKIARANDFELASYYEKVIAAITKHIGENKYEPMYKNFPEEVIAMPKAELYYNALCHYFSVWLKDIQVIDSAWLPDSFKSAKSPLAKRSCFKVLRIVDTDAKLSEIATDLVNSNTSLSPDQKKELVFLFKNGYLKSIDEAKYKENITLVLAELLNSKTFDVTKYLKTATDALRLCIAYSEGDVSLKNKTYFKTLKRPVRRKILAFLDSLNPETFEYDVNRHKAHWKGLVRKLKAGDYKHLYPNAVNVFQKLYRDVTRSPYSAIEVAIKHNHIRAAVLNLLKYPGDFARRLSKLVRSTNEPQWVIANFIKVIEKVSTPVLLQIIQAFANKDVRVVMPKGNLNKMMVIKEVDVTKFHTDIANTVTIELLRRFKKLPELGKVYIDETLFSIPAIFSNRNATEGMRLIPRGSRFKLGEGNIVRFFVWWKDIENKENTYAGRVDIDLSAKLFREDFKFHQDIAYYNLKEFGGTHSGDITSAPNGASEYIDIDINKVLSKGYRYVVMCCNSFTGQTFDEIPEVNAGWMIRDGKTGEIYEPSTVENRFKVNNDNRFVCPLIIDLAKGEVIWLDVQMSVLGSCSNASNKHSQIEMLSKAFINKEFVSMGGVLLLHTLARGEALVDNPKEADTIFDKDFILELEKFTSQYLV